MRRLVPFVGTFVARKFVGGWSAEEAVVRAQEYVGAGYGVSLNNMVEHVADPDLVERNVREALSLIATLREFALAAHLAVKPSSIGSEVGVSAATPFNSDLVRANLARILDAATELPLASEIEIDAEGYRAADPLWDVIADLHRFHAQGFRLRLALQAFLDRFEERAAVSARIGLRVRIVKGSPLYADPVRYGNLSDAEIADRCLFAFALHVRAGNHPLGAVMWDRTMGERYRGFGERCRTIAGLFPFEIQMLHGTGAAIGMALRAAGVPVRVYLPYVPGFTTKAAAAGYVERRIEAGLALAMRKFRIL